MKIKKGETLLLYDCELLFQAQDQQGQTYMVSHIGKCHGECEYIAVPVKQNNLSEYNAGRIDLRELMLTGEREIWYSARATTNPGELALQPQDTPLAESPELPPGRASITTTSSASTQNPDQDRSLYLRSDPHRNPPLLAHLPTGRLPGHTPRPRVLTLAAAQLRHFDDSSPLRPSSRIPDHVREPPTA